MLFRQARKIRVCIIPGGSSKIRNFEVRPWSLPLVILFLCALVGALGFYSYRSHQTIAAFVDRTAEIETLSAANASLEAQIDIFADKVAVLDKELGQIKNGDMEVAALKDDVSRQLGVNPDMPMEELLPYLRAVVSWADSQNGVGGSEQLASTLSAAVAGSSRKVIRGMHRDLDRLMMETGDTGHYLSTVREGLNGASSVLASTPLFIPVNGRISAKFGHRASPFGSRSVDLHRGLDIPTPIGTAVKSPADGTVLSAGRSGGYGLLLTIDHGYGLVTRYAHLSDTLVEPGDQVVRGQNIARTGNSGRSTGPHLHYETILGGLAVDPLSFLPSTVVKNLTFGSTASALD